MGCRRTDDPAAALEAPESDEDEDEVCCKSADDEPDVRRPERVDLEDAREKPCASPAVPVLAKGGRAEEEPDWPAVALLAASGDGEPVPGEPLPIKAGGWGA